MFVQHIKIQRKTLIISFFPSDSGDFISFSLFCWIAISYRLLLPLFFLHSLIFFLIFSLFIPTTQIQQFNFYNILFKTYKIFVPIFIFISSRFILNLYLYFIFLINFFIISTFNINIEFESFEFKSHVVLTWSHCRYELVTQNFTK